jgi:hypothetical protein
MPSSDEDSDEGDEMIPAFGLLNLCSDRIDAVGVYLLDTPDLILVYVCRSVSQQFTSDVLNCTSFNQLSEMVSRKYSPNDDKELSDEFVWNVQNELPELETVSSTRIRSFVNHLQSLKPFPVPVRVVRYRFTSFASLQRNLRIVASEMVPIFAQELTTLVIMFAERTAVSACCLWGALWRTGVTLRGTTPVTTSSFRKLKILSNR